jgi:CRISPR-associated endonuclease/helicase Cas3
MEAGVDVDFPQAWREKAGLDSILQAAGRCNREGKRTAEESKVVLFSLMDGAPKHMRPNLAAAEIALEDAAHPDESPAIETYFNQLYRMNGEKGLDIKGILDSCGKYAFKTIADDFHLIDSDTCTIYIPSIDNAADLEALKAGIYSRDLMRRLGRSAVNVYKWDFEKLNEAGKLQQMDEYTAILLDKENNYDEQCGLKLDAISSIGLFE